VLLHSQVGQAIGLFAVTNVDDLVVLALFFARARGRRHGVTRVVIGQYLGFIAIVGLAAAGALGVRLLPGSVIPYLGLLPLLLGLRAAWQVWQGCRRGDNDGPGDSDTPEDGPRHGVGVLSVATVTFANGGDNIAVYVPVFATAGNAGLVTYVITFLALVALWCTGALFFSAHPAVARILARCGHILLPVVLIALGLVILIEGGVLRF
jgi:cadmium resistance protein CadD (predicted permease)